MSEPHPTPYYPQRWRRERWERTRNDLLLVGARGQVRGVLEFRADAVFHGLWRNPAQTLTYPTHAFQAAKAATEAELVGSSLPDAAGVR
jgi:lipopolysaccharide biosynthesis protein